MSGKEATAKNEVIMVINEDNNDSKSDIMHEIINEYERLNDKCAKVLKKIKQRKAKK